MQKQICVYMASLKSHLGFEARTCCLHPHMDAHHFCQAYTLCNVEKKCNRLHIHNGAFLSFALLRNHAQYGFIKGHTFQEASFTPKFVLTDFKTFLHERTFNLKTWTALLFPHQKQHSQPKKNRKSIGPFPYQWQMLVCKMSPTPLMRSYGRMSCKKGSFQQMHHNDELSKAVERSTMVESFDNVLHD